MADTVKKKMQDLAKSKPRAATNGNRTRTKDTKTRSDAQHGQTDIKKAKGRPPKATR